MATALSKKQQNITFINIEAPNATALMSGPQELHPGQRGLALDSNTVVWRDKSGNFHLLGGSDTHNVWAKRSEFPAQGTEKTLYIATDVNRIYMWNPTHSDYEPLGGSGGGADVWEVEEL
jgi:hypothetical protein